MPMPRCLDKGFFVLVGNNHHIVSDGPSVRMVVEELIENYRHTTVRDTDNQ